MLGHESKKLHLKQSSTPGMLSFVSPGISRGTFARVPALCPVFQGHNVVRKQILPSVHVPRAAVTDNRRTVNQAQYSGNVRKRERPVVREIRESQQLRKQGKWREAQEILETVGEETKHDSKYLNELLHLRVAELCEKNPFISAVEMYKDLSLLSDSVPAERTATTYNAILLGLKNTREKQAASESQLSEKLKQAAHVFDKMLETNVVPDHFTMSILFRMCASDRNLEETKNFEQKAKEAFGFEGNLISGSALLAAYAKCQDISSLEEALADLEARGVPLNERTYASIISAYHRAGNHAKVIETFRKALSSESVQPHLFLFSGALASCWRARDSANARFIFEAMEESDVEPTEDIFSNLFEIATRSGDVPLGADILFDWAPRFEVFKPNVNHFTHLIDSCKKSLVSIERTEATLKDITNRMKAETTMKPNVPMLNALISAFLKIGSFANAQLVLEKEFSDLNLVPDVGTYNNLMYGLGKAKGYKYALKVLQIMKKNGVKPDQVTYNTLTDLLRDAKEDKLLKGIVSAMEADTNAVSDFVQFSSRLKTCRTQKDSRAALQEYWNAVKTNSKIDSLTNGLMLYTLLENECETEAVTLLGWLLWKKQASSTVFNTLMDYAKRRKDYAACRAIFDIMKKKGIAPDKRSYSIIISSYCRQGLIDSAFRMLGEMQDVGLGTTDTHSWTMVIDACGRVGQWQRAVEVLKSMRDSKSRLKFVPAPTTSCYNAAIYATGMKGGGWKHAQDVYKLLLDDKDQMPDFVTFSVMASTILQNRSEINEWALVEDIWVKLKTFVEAELEKQGTNSHTSGKTPVAPSRSELKKLAGKAKRLEWVLHNAQDQNARSD